MELKAFTDCTLDYLEQTFGLIPTLDNSLLDDWLVRPADISDFERQELLSFQEPLILNVLHWNEQELSLGFIGPMLTLARFTGPHFNLFANRLIKAVVDGIELFGKPDAFIASGFRAPRIPFFAFTEFKKDIDPSGDPAGQALAAMLVGQTLNRNEGDAASRPIDPNLPIYGCYVNGRDWNFMILTGRTYCISADYSARTDDIFDIFRILKALKQLVTERTAARTESG